ncbi:MAG: hypothetical protein KAJ52_09485, partial [Sedimentisphaerales bacterium]|nr:hypothetical protein [Sedimentisphaerales bacterium]
KTCVSGLIIKIPRTFDAMLKKNFCNRSRGFSLPDPKGVITIIAAGEGRRPKPVVGSAKYPDGKMTIL